MNPLIVFLSTVAIIISWCSLLDLLQYRKDKKHDTERSKEESEDS